MNLQEADSAAGAVAVAPRVTLADIEDAVHYCYYFTADKAVDATKPPTMPLAPSLGLLTICVLVMANGFTVIGKSAPASAANFNVELGRKLAREDAVRQLWPLMGYALRDKLAAAV